MDSGYYMLAVFTQVVSFRLLATLLTAELLPKITGLKLKIS
ncbi:hypothetical protein MAXJ12_19558 [Mesorhizobium alhagi CCNWXJ12-2]|uniref:Uncharacterized protein n=1 Tax=Mesorhizobium alhagi CCNWXJ12-2 TaxID=1107882 RepID=H0HUR1_9HYPH|nr:hypothetical protein MAXJ12_19558 [Mesorhizobium alhagi CCNWXJ12-2]